MASWYRIDPTQTINRGDVVCVVAATDRLLVCRATSANLAQSNGVLGIALSGWTGSATASAAEAGVRVAEGGIVEAPVVAMQAGAGRLVTVNAEGRCARVSARGEGVHIVGATGPDGSVLVRPELPALPAQTQNAIVDSANAILAQLTEAKNSLNTQIAALSTRVSGQATTLDGLDSTRATKSDLSLLRGRVESLETQLATLRTSVDQLLSAGTGTSAPTPSAPASQPTRLGLVSTSISLRTTTPTSLPSAPVLDQRDQEIPGLNASWASSAPGVARVDGGNVIAVSNGTSTLTASYGTLPAVTCTVTVTELPRVVSALHFDGNSLLGATNLDQNGRPAFGMHEGSLTIECWVRVTSLKGADPHYYGYLPYRAPSYEYLFYLHQDSARGPISLRYEGNGTHDTTARAVYAERAFDLGRWTHVAVVRDIERREVALFVDGRELVRRTGCMPMQTPGGLEMFRLGGLLTGELSTLRLWTVARSAEQIQANYRRRFSRASGLLGAWTFEDVAPRNLAVDSAGARISLGDLTAIGSDLRPVATSTLTVVTDGPTLIEGDPVEVTAAASPRTSATPRAALQLPAGAMAQLASVPAGLGAQYTVEVWIRIGAGSGTRKLICLPGAHVTLDATPKLSCNWSGSFSTETLAMDTWLHVAITRDTTANQATIYVYNSATGATTSVSGTSGTWSGDPSPSLGGFGGAIADLRIWSGQRTAAEIAATRLSLPTASRTTLLAWWPCDEGSGGVIYDRRGLVHGALAGTSWTSLPATVALSTGTWELPAAPTTAPADPPTCWPVLSAGGGFLVPYVESLARARSWTVEMWIRPGRATGDARLFAMECLPQNGRGIVMAYYANPYRDFGSYSAGAALARTQIDYTDAWPAREDWTHVAFVRDLSSTGAGEQRVYLDGVLAGSTTFTTTGDGAAPVMPIKLGAGFTGAMAEVRAWDRARTVAEIRATMRQRVVSATNLVGCWPLDDRGPVARALVGPSGVSTGAAWESARPGIFPPWGVSTPGGSLLTFNETGTVTIADRSVLHQMGGQYTVECWIKPAALGGRLFSKGMTTGYNQECVLRLTSAGLVEFWYGRTGNDMHCSGGPATPVVVGQWSHVSVVYDSRGRDNVRVTVNGETATRDTANGRLTDGAFSTQPVIIGAAFKGQIADVRLWRGEPTIPLATRRLTRYSAPVEGLLGSWPLDDASDLIADLSGNQLHGVLSGAATWSAGAPTRT